MMRRTWILLMCTVFLAPLYAEDLVYKERLVTELVTKVPQILEDYDAKTGRFGTGIWICNDQHAMYPLAVAYYLNAPGNRYYKDGGLLEVIMKAGDALIDDADAKGQWVFRKKDGSTWGKIWMPWTYSRWARSFLLIREDMPKERYRAWEEALLLGFKGIEDTQLKNVHNIPAHHALGLYAAGRALEQPAWCEKAAGFLRKVASAQSEGGYWTEGGGPVVLYNYVYVDALGTYYAMSRDQSVLPALRKVALFHRHFTYPGGQNVETVDQRNPYRDSVSPGNVGFTMTPAGRSYLKRQWSSYGMENLDADLIASLLLYGEEGALLEGPASASEPLFVLREGGADRAATLRKGPWFLCLSAYVVPLSRSRWIQDRQSFVSVFHERTGLILGGGNTKLQPAWSNFTVGDMALLRHEPGDEKPDFAPKGDLFHMPSKVTLVQEPVPGLDMAYGKEACRIRLELEETGTLALTLEATVSSGLPVAGHLTLIPHFGKALETGGGKRFILGDTPIALSAEEVSGMVRHGGCRVRLPGSATLNWPALPHNPYRKDGHADPEEGRIEIRIPFDEQHRRHEILLEILE